jgi:hypothetical protein
VLVPLLVLLKLLVVAGEGQAVRCRQLHSLNCRLQQASQWQQQKQQ